MLEAFDCSGAPIEMLTGGRTNDTWRVEADRGLVIQHVRADGGADLLAMMENLVRVTSHLEWQHYTGSRKDEPTWWPILVPTGAGRPFIMDDAGDVWRAFVYRPGRIPRGPMPDESIVSGARCFARFAAATAELGGDPLRESTKQFHNLDAVIGDFEAALAAAELAGDKRLAGVGPHTEQIELLLRRVTDLSERDGLGAIGHRVVHNDTKFTNSLLAPDGHEVVAVLDLDLAMMGPIWHDVGDLVRSSAWHHHKSGPTQPFFDLDLTAAVVTAYTQAAEDHIGDDEIATLAVAGPRLAFELGVRYLTDHLRHIPVLRVEGTDGHLRRGTANLNLAAEMLTAYDALRSVVDQLAAAQSR